MRRTRRSLMVAAGWAPLLALAGEQRVMPAQNELTVARGDRVTIAYRYQTADPATATLVGLGVRVHFEGAQFAFLGFDDLHRGGLLAVDTHAQRDTTDADQSETTDQFVSAVWVDVNGRWPGTSEADLFTVNFRVADDAAGDTTVRLSAIDTAKGFSFNSEPVVVHVR